MYIRFKNIYTFFISNYGQASALIVAYIFKVFGAVTHVCGEYNNFQDSRSIFMIIDFKIFPVMPFETPEFGVLLV